VIKLTNRLKKYIFINTIYSRGRGEGRGGGGERREEGGKYIAKNTPSCHQASGYADEELPTVFLLSC
jgi:hypothetical protein